MGFAYFRAVAAGLLLAAVSAEAHEIGTTRVEALFRRDHTYVIDVVTSSDALQRRRATPQMLLESAEIRFGGQRVTPRLSMLPGPIIRFEGGIPDDARDFSWRYRLTFASYALTAANEGDPPQTQWISGDDPSKPFALSRAVIVPGRVDVARQYLALGFTHIIPFGLDHILFVIGLFLLSVKLRPLLIQVTAFTIAHSITLGLTIYGVLSVSPRIVEPMIALSIAYIAIENLTTSELRPWRVGIVAAFGLLHGMGFAGVLSELGLPRSQFLTALVAFNAGVEIGQLSVIAIAAVLFGWWSQRGGYRRRFVVPASAAIAATGVFWTIQRTFF